MRLKKEQAEIDPSLAIGLKKYFIFLLFRKEVLSEQSFETNDFILSKSKTMVSERLQNLREGLVKKCIMDELAYVPRRYRI